MMKIKRITEKVGVPEDLLERAEILTTKVLDLISEFQPTEQDSDERSETWTFYDEDLNFQIEDVHFQNLKLIVQIQKGIVRDIEGVDDIILMGYGVMTPKQFDRESAKLKTSYEGELVMTLSFATKGEYEINDLVECMYHQEDLYGTMAHELKHIYDNVYKKNTSVYGSSRYAAITNIQKHLPLPSIQKLMFECYYTILEENLVRPSEMLGKMKTRGITKSTFSSWFQSSEIVSKLNDIKNKTFDSFYEEILTNEMDLVRRFVNEFYELDPDLPDDQVVYMLLEVICENFYKMMTSQIMSTSVSGLDFMQIVTEEPTEKVSKMIEKISKEAEKHKNDPVTFFEKLIEKNSKTAEKMIKKLSRLYSVSPDDEAKNEVKTFDQFKTYSSRSLKSRS